MDEDAVGGLPLTLEGTTNVFLTFTIVNGPFHGVAAQPTAGGPDVQYDPDPDFYGRDYFDYVVDDGSITSLTARVIINVLPVNDAPSFTIPATLNVFEDWKGVGINGFATGISVGPSNEGQAYRFFVYNDNPSLFLVPPYLLVSGGKLTFVPAKNANGSANVDVVMEDTGGTLRGGVNRATNSFTLFVDAVNDQPSFTLATNRIVVLENAAPVLIPGFATLSAGPVDETEGFDDFVITRNTNPGLFSVGPDLNAAGELSFEINQFSNGVAVVSVKVSDQGGTANGGKDTSIVKSFTISVLPVNQPPYFELDAFLAANQVVLEDATNQLVRNFIDLNTLSKGPVNEAAQGFTFIIQTTNPGLFQGLPYIRNIATNRTYTNFALIYRPKPNSNGVADINVIMRDSGGTLNGGDNSYTNSFTITVVPVNDPPSATINNHVYSVREDAGPVSTNWFKYLKTGPVEYHESTQTLSFVTFNDQPGLFSVPPAVDPAGVLTFTSAPDANGVARITVNMFDSGPTGGSGDINNMTYNFELRVNPVNDVPFFSITQNLVQVSFNAGLVRKQVLSFSPGATNEDFQTVNYQLVNNTNQTMFSRQPIIYPGGLLEFAPTNDFGAIGKQVTLGVRAVDNGGVLYGGANTTPYVTNLTIKITP